jgi:hypothetical protein
MASAFSFKENKDAYFFYVFFGILKMMDFRFHRHRRWAELPEHQKKFLKKSQEQPSLLNRFFHRYATFLLSGICFGLFVVSIVLYFTHTWYAHEALILHLGAVFLELALAILVIEELIKSNVEDEEVQRKKWEKKTHFLRKFLRNHIDALALDYLKNIEASSDLFLELRNQKNKNESITYTERRDLLQKYASYFSYFDRLTPKHCVDAVSTVQSDIHVRYETWEMLLEEAMKNMKLVANKPQYTPHLSWDMLIEWYVALKRFQHQDKYLVQQVTEEEEELRLYLAGMKFFSAFILDLELFDIAEESLIAKHPMVRKFAHEVWDIWHE